MRLYAQVTNQGTAMPETALCGNCWQIAAFRAAHATTIDAEHNTPLNNTDWHDVTGNQVIQEVGCQSCGWPSRIECPEFMRQVLDAFPFAQVEEDNDGQLVIYTGLITERVKVNGEWVEANAVLMP